MRCPECFIPSDFLRHTIGVVDLFCGTIFMQRKRLGEPSQSPF